MNTTQTVKEALRAQRVNASLATQGIKLSTRNGYTVRGNTYPVRAILKAAGFRFSKGEWARFDRAVYRDVNPTELGSAMLEKLSR